MDEQYTMGFGTMPHDEEAGRRETQEQNPSIPLSGLSAGLLTALIFILPLAVLPVLAFAPSVLKTLIFVVLGLAAGSVALFAAHRSQNVSLPLVYTSLLLGVLVSLVLSLVFSTSFSSSLFGNNLEIGTFYVTGVAVFVAMTMPLVFTLKNRIFNFFLAFFGAAAALFLYHVLRLLFGADFLSLGIFTIPSMSPVGSWNDFGIFAGLTLMVSLALLTFGSFPKRLTHGLKALLFAALFFVGIVNFMLLSITLFIFSLFFTGYAFLKKSKNKVTPILISVALLLFVLLSGRLGAFAGNVFGISYVEIRPNVQSTLEVAREVLDTPGEVFFGTGLNTFTYLWQEARSDEIIQSNFWSVEFMQGSGVLPTLFISLGLVGTLALLALFAYLLVSGFKFFTEEREGDAFVKSIQAASLVGALLLFVLGFVYVFSIVIYVLMFAFLGLFVSSRMLTRDVRVMSLSNGHDDEESVLGSVVLGLAVFGLIAIIPAFSTALGRVSYAQGLRIAANAEDVTDIEQAIQKIESAAFFERNDAYYRTLVDLDLARIQELLAREDVSEDVLVEQFSTLLAETQEHMQAARNIDPQNYLNWVTLGLVYESFGTLGVDTQNAYVSAEQAYDQARALNPTNPELLLIQARLELARDNMEEAEALIEEAITQKPNFSDAYLLLAQMSLGDEDVEGAIAAIDRAIEANSESPSPFLHYQRGLVHYFDESYGAAIEDFKEALDLDPAYANARYFYALALVYGESDREAALEELEIVQASNPEEETLPLVIENIENGLDPLAGLSAEEAAGGEPELTEETNAEAVDLTGEEDPVDTTTSTDTESDAAEDTATGAEENAPAE